MLRLELRPAPSRVWAWASPLLALAITVVLGVVLFAVMGKDPVRGLQIFFWEPIKSAYALGELGIKATPLLLIALGLAVCFRSNIWNIGAEGQYIIGAIFAGGVALTADKNTGGWIVVAVLLAGVLGGMLWAAVTALLRDQAAGIIDRFKVKAAGPQALARSRSGGNLQKFIMGREIDANPTLLIVSQPTWGVDVGASAQIRAEILALRDAGCAVLVVSEELDELFELCDRLHVMAKGQLSPAVERRDATVEQIGAWMSGLWHGDVQQHLADMERGGEVAHAH